MALAPSYTMGQNTFLHIQWDKTIIIKMDDHYSCTRPTATLVMLPDSSVFLEAKDDLMLLLLCDQCLHSSLDCL